MAKKSNSGKIIAIALFVVVAAAAFFGYSRQSSEMTKTAQEVNGEMANEGLGILTPKPSDIIMGDANALITIVEYSSLSCTHCAHFHKEVLPTLDKDLIATGKIRLVLRHFPLNEPALRAAALVECAGANGGQRSNFMKVLFDMQAQWAFNENFLKELQKIALVGGVDSAAFESCMADKELEARLLTGRQEAAEKLGVNSTPSFFINGTKFEGDVSVDGFTKAISEAAPPKK